MIEFVLIEKIAIGLFAIALSLGLDGVGTMTLPPPSAPIFPALALQPDGKSLVYLDNAASALKPRQVLERMTRAYESEYANVHRGLHYLAGAPS